MNYKLVLAAAIATVAFAPVSHADIPFYPYFKEKGLYVTGQGGFNQTSDADFDVGGVGDGSYNGGYVGLGSIGYSFRPGWRAEIEGSYRRNDLDEVAGRTESYGAMANVLYDIPTEYMNWLPRFATRFNPYVGLGVGMAWVDTETNSGAVDGHELEFAYQGIVGVDYSVTPTVKLGVNYRYFGTTDYEINEDTAGGSDDAKYRNHSVLASVKYTFPTAKPVVQTQTTTGVVTKTEQVVRTEQPNVYQVFFGFDRSDLNAAAKKTVAEAASVAKSKSPINLTVSGHTDSSGANSYNEALSAKRAAAVKAELVRNGLAANDIVIKALGEDDQLVPTGDQTKAAENRRAVIIVR